MFKGGASMPLVLVITIVIISVVILLSYLFIFQTKEKLEVAFVDLTGSVSDFGCSVMGPAKATVCPG